jgi:hypothetical protein
MHDTQNHAWQLLVSIFEFMYQMQPMKIADTPQLSRFCASKSTISFLVFSVFYFSVQVLLQTVILLNDSLALNTIRSVMDQGNVTLPGFPVLGTDLRQCETVPRTIDTSGCAIVWSPRLLDHSYQLNLLEEAATGVSVVVDMTSTSSKLFLPAVSSREGIASKTGVLSTVVSITSSAINPGELPAKGPKEDSINSPSRQCLEALGWPIFQYYFQ